MIKSSDFFTLAGLSNSKYLTHILCSKLTSQASRICSSFKKIEGTFDNGILNIKSIHDISTNEDKLAKLVSDINSFLSSLEEITTGDVDFPKSIESSKISLMLIEAYIVSLRVNDILLYSPSTSIVLKNLSKSSCEVIISMLLNLPGHISDHNFELIIDLIENVLQISHNHLPVHSILCIETFFKVMTSWSRSYNNKKKVFLAFSEHLLTAFLNCIQNSPNIFSVSKLHTCILDFVCVSLFDEKSLEELLSHFQIDSLASALQLPVLTKKRPREATSTSVSNFNVSYYCSLYAAIASNVNEQPKSDSEKSGYSSVLEDEKSARIAAGISNLLKLYAAVSNKTCDAAAAVSQDYGSKDGGGSSSAAARLKHICRILQFALNLLTACGCYGSSSLDSKSVPPAAADGTYEPPMDGTSALKKARKSINKNDNVKHSVSQPIPMIKSLTSRQLACQNRLLESLVEVTREFGALQAHHDTIRNLLLRLGHVSQSAAQSIRTITQKLYKDKRVSLPSITSASVVSAMVRSSSSGQAPDLNVTSATAVDSVDSFLRSLSFLIDLDHRIVLGWGGNEKEGLKEVVGVVAVGAAAMSLLPNRTTGTDDRTSAGIGRSSGQSAVDLILRLIRTAVSLSRFHELVSALVAIDLVQLKTDDTEEPFQSSLYLSRILGQETVQLALSQSFGTLNSSQINLVWSAISAGKDNDETVSTERSTGLVLAALLVPLIGASRFPNLLPVQSVAALMTKVVAGAMRCYGESDAGPWLLSASHILNLAARSLTHTVSEEVDDVGRTGRNSVSETIEASELSGECVSSSGQTESQSQSEDMTRPDHQWKLFSTECKRLYIVLQQEYSRTATAYTCIGVLLNLALYALNSSDVSGDDEDRLVIVDILDLVWDRVKQQEQEQSADSFPLLVKSFGIWNDPNYHIFQDKFLQSDMLALWTKKVINDATLATSITSLDTELVMDWLTVTARSKSKFQQAIESVLSTLEFDLLSTQTALTDLGTGAGAEETDCRPQRRNLLIRLGRTLHLCLRLISSYGRTRDALLAVLLKTLQLLECLHNQIITADGIGDDLDKDKAIHSIWFHAVDSAGRLVRLLTILHKKRETPTSIALKYQSSLYKLIRQTAILWIKSRATNSFQSYLTSHDNAHTGEEEEDSLGSLLQVLIDFTLNCSLRTNDVSAFDLLNAIKSLVYRQQYQESDRTGQEEGENIGLHNKSAMTSTHASKVRRKNKKNSDYGSVLLTTACNSIHSLCKQNVSPGNSQQQVVLLFSSHRPRLQTYMQELMSYCHSSLSVQTAISTSDKRQTHTQIVESVTSNNAICRVTADCYRCLVALSPSGLLLVPLPTIPSYHPCYDPQSWLYLVGTVCAVNGNSIVDHSGSSASRVLLSEKICQLLSQITDILLTTDNEILPAYIDLTIRSLLRVAPPDEVVPVMGRLVHLLILKCESTSKVTAFQLLNVVVVAQAIQNDYSRYVLPIFTSSIRSILLVVISKFKFIPYWNLNDDNYIDARDWDKVLMRLIALVSAGLDSAVGHSRSLAAGTDSIAHSHSQSHSHSHAGGHKSGAGGGVDASAIWSEICLTCLALIASALQSAISNSSPATDSSNIKTNTTSTGTGSSGTYRRNTRTSIRNEKTAGPRRGEETDKARQLDKRLVSMAQMYASVLSLLEQLLSLSSVFLGATVGIIGNIFRDLLQALVQTYVLSKDKSFICPCLRVASRALVAAASCKELQKHASQLAATLIDSLANYAILTTSDIRDLLVPGIFALFDQCQLKQRQQLHAVLDGQSSVLYKDLNEVYLSDYKFVGKS